MNENASFPGIYTFYRSEQKPEIHCESYLVCSLTFFNHFVHDLLLFCIDAVCLFFPSRLQLHDIWALAEAGNLLFLILENLLFK